MLGFRRNIRHEDMRPARLAKENQSVLCLGEIVPGDPLTRGYSIARIVNGRPCNQYGIIPGEFVGWWPLPALPYEASVK